MPGASSEMLSSAACGAPQLRAEYLAALLAPPSRATARAPKGAATAAHGAKALLLQSRLAGVLGGARGGISGDESERPRCSSIGFTV